MGGPLGPCDDCERNSWALMTFGARIEALRAGARPRGVLTLAADDLAAAVGGRRRTSLLAELDRFVPGRCLETAVGLSAVAACRHQGGFPWPEQLSYDPEPPWVLHLIGDPSVLAEAASGRGVAVVGARRADGYGRATARGLGLAVVQASGIVVSGLAFGVDAEAHEGALSAAGGRTLAVVGGGADHVYPAANAGLRRRILSAGAVVSEMPFGCGVWRWSFPARNRLIAAFSAVVAVVQGARGSGSLHTAEAALARSKAVAAVPGRIGEPLSEGSNSLIADGAMPILGSADLLRAAGLEIAQGVGIPDRLASAARAVAAGEADLLSNQLGAGAAAALLGELELQGIAERDGAGTWRLIGGSG